MRLQTWLGLAIVAAIITGLLPAWAFAAPPAQEEIGPNLLVDGNFESPPVIQDGVGEVQVAPGWRAWYLDVPPSYVVPPPSCYNANGGKRDNGCYWMRPEFRDTIRQSHSNRVHGGDRSQKYFSFGRMHEGGLYQQVNNVPAGAKLRFSIYIQAWMCSDASSGKCNDGRISDAPADMHLRVGIDPTGGTNPFGPNIVWSGEVAAWDQWVRFQVEAIAQSSTVTVFTHSRPEWDWARMNNDVYLDDAELVTVGPIPTPTPEAAAVQPAADNQPQVQPQAQVQPITKANGTTVHQVSSGDTLLGIALAYGVTVDEVVAWNRLNPGDFLQIDQELVVKAPAGWVAPVQAAANPPAAAAQSTPAAPAAPTPAPQPQAVANAPTSPAGLCVVAFDDQNMNSLYEDKEGLVAQTQFDVLSSDAVIKSYTTDGSSEPYCFFDLNPGTYIVSARLASGYKATSVEKTGVSLAAGQTVNVAFGSISTGKQPASKAGDKAAAPVSAASQAQQSSPNIFTRMGGFLVGASGIIVLGLAIVVGLAMSRRR